VLRLLDGTRDVRDVAAALAPEVQAGALTLPPDAMLEGAVASTLEQLCRDGLLVG
jgi:hypothetical protein